MRRSTLLFSAAAIALVIGGWPALSRVYHSYVQRQEQAARQQQLSQETAQLKAELQTSNPALLAELHCDEAQGYLYSKALPPQVLLQRWLQQPTTETAPSSTPKA